MAFEERAPNILFGTSTPRPGELGKRLCDYGVEVIVGHPTYRNETTIGPLLEKGIAAASASFGGRRVAFLVSDGTQTGAQPDRTTAEAAVSGALQAMEAMTPTEREGFITVIAPYEGYGGDTTPGKGSALKMIFDEMGETDASMLVLLDGDLRNDMARWHSVFARVEARHREEYGERPMFVTARYARHFVDASLTRFIVGPLTTLMGTYVPGGISGDIGLSSAAVAKEREAAWTSARRRYGTDISTTFDNIADPETVIWEVYLGAKLHDITDEAKLSEMPGQVIGAALERLLHWQQHDGRVIELIKAERELETPRMWGPERTGIDFVDPGATDAFDVDVKMRGLVEKHDDHAADIERVTGARVAELLSGRVQGLAQTLAGGSGRPTELAFLGVDQELWIDVIYRAVAYTLSTEDVVRARRCLNYLYTAAFLEFVKDRLVELGYSTVEEVRAVQKRLAVPADLAPSFYENSVDTVAENLALEFYGGRSRMLDYL